MCKQKEKGGQLKCTLSKRDCITLVVMMIILLYDRTIKLKTTFRLQKKVYITLSLGVNLTTEPKCPNQQ